jgi:hypothetical protein
MATMPSFTVDVFLDEIVHHRIGAERIFDDEAGRRCRADMQAGIKAWRAGPQMRRSAG